MKKCRSVYYNVILWSNYNVVSLQKKLIFILYYKDPKHGCSGLVYLLPFTHDSDDLKTGPMLQIFNVNNDVAVFGH